MTLDKNAVEVLLPSSKSESNRCLILQGMNPEKIVIKNLSQAEDTKILKSILIDFKTNPTKKTDYEYNVGHAGTAMRFLTAFFCIQDGYSVLLTGSKRMKERPIKPLVDALNSIGAAIHYKEKEGFPPLLIEGKNLIKDKLVIDASISSQYISALLLIAPKLTNGLSIYTKNKIVSSPYIDMTIRLLGKAGIEVSHKNNDFTVSHQQFKNTAFTIESDWSSASYWYEYLALAHSTNLNIILKGLKKDSLQGDSILPELYKVFGIKTSFIEEGIIIKKLPHFTQQTFIEMNLENTPDLA